MFNAASACFDLRAARWETSQTKPKIRSFILGFVLNKLKGDQQLCFCDTFELSPPTNTLRCKVIPVCAVDTAGWHRIYRATKDK